MTQPHKGYVHFSDRQVHAVTSVQQRPLAHAPLKPEGLWLSVEGNGDGWSDWCVAENFRVHCLTHAHAVVLTSDANVLRLSTPRDIDLFTERYGVLPFPGLSNKWIDWESVAREYQGIVIAPYIHLRRLSFSAFWYYGWDCASGCIWDAKAIASIDLIGHAASADGSPRPSVIDSASGTSGRSSGSSPG